MEKPIVDLCETLMLSGREIDSRAVERLVKYWAVRTPLSVSDVCRAFKEDSRLGWPIGLSKRGYR